LFWSLINIENVVSRNDYEKHVTCFPLLIGGCASENSSPKAILMDLIEQKNPVDIDWVNSFSGSGAKFKWHYPTDEYKLLNKLNEACNIWFESSSPDSKSTLIGVLRPSPRNLN